MAKFNSITIVGRLTADPISRIVGETAQCSFKVAVDRDYKKKDSENYDTDFIPCVAWGKLAEIIETYCKKGKLVLVEGRLQIRQYDKDGQTHWMTEIIANKFQMLSPKDSEGNSKPEPNPDDQSNTQPVTNSEEAPF